MVDKLVEDFGHHVDTGEVNRKQVIKTEIFRKTSG
jgi:hypothetical protein